MEYEVFEWLLILQSELDRYMQNALEELSSHVSLLRAMILGVALIELFILFMIFMNCRWVQTQLEPHTSAEKIFILSFFTLFISGISLLIMGTGLLALNYAREFSIFALAAAGLNALVVLVACVVCLLMFLLLFARLFIARIPARPVLSYEVNWGGTPMLIIVMAFFIISFIATLFSSTAGAYAGSLALILLPLYLVLYTYDRSAETMGFQKPVMKWILVLLPAIFVLLFLNELVYEITERILGQFPLEELMEELLTENPLLMGINTGVLGPIGEEVFFRGFVYTGLRRKYGVKNGILLSSLFFGLTHGIPWQIPYAFVAGIILAYVYEKTGSLYSPILLHVINNSLSVIGIMS